MHVCVHVFVRVHVFVCDNLTLFSPLSLTMTGPWCLFIIHLLSFLSSSCSAVVSWVILSCLEHFIMAVIPCMHAMAKCNKRVRTACVHSWTKTTFSTVILLKCAMVDKSSKLTDIMACLRLNVWNPLPPPWGCDQQCLYSNFPNLPSQQSHPLHAAIGCVCGGGKVCMVWTSLSNSLVFLSPLMWTTRCNTTNAFQQRRSLWWQAFHLAFECGCWVQLCTILPSGVVTHLTS